MKTLVQFFSGFPLGLFLLVLPADPSDNPDYSMPPPDLAQEPAFCQIIISEIMADPTPSVLLPEAEYVELFNRGSAAINLEGWKLVFGNHEKILGAAILESESYLIICDSGNENDFQAYGKALTLPNMPAVVNTGQTLTLKSVSGAVIHSVTFSPDWFHSPSKSAGGWSLEIIDPDNPCGNADNWSESSDPRGGSPGAQNSVKTGNPDKLPPSLLRATLPSDSSVMLLFNESMDSSSLNSPWLYSASEGLLHPLAANPAGPDYSAVLLTFPLRFQPAVRYTVTVLNSLKDCVGNALAGNSAADFAIPQTPSTFDLIINEILFDPVSGKSEFIELYNRSSKVLDLSDFTIALADLNTGEIVKMVPLNKNPFLIFPAGYVVITREAKSLPDNGYLHYSPVFVELSDLFTLPDEEGIIVLSDHALHTMDEFRYHQSMHAGLFDRKEGISLERIDCDLPTNMPENWQSAATSAGYSTPGRQNSQAVHQEHTGEEIILQPETFSPDQDGIDDYMTLHLQFREPGWMATIIIFDRHGNKIRNLSSKCLLGTEEYFTWDGFTDDQGMAGIGIYVVYVEIFRQTGEIKNFRKVITLARRL
jgi:hypothetical protein